MSRFLATRLSVAPGAGLVLGLLVMSGMGPVKDPPLAPTELAASAGKAGRVVLSWKDNSDVETGYRVTRDPPFEEGAVSVPADTVQFEDYPGKGTFVYSVVAFNDGGESAVLTTDGVRVDSGVAGLHGPLTPGGGSGGIAAGGGGAATNGGATGTSGDPGSPGNGPAAPTRVRLRTVEGSLVVEWTDQSSDEDGFEVQRQVSGIPSWLSDAVFRVGANVQSYSDAPPGAGLYRYRVRAVNGAGVSAYTGWVIGMSSGQGGQGNTPPAAPSNPGASDIGSGRAMVSWADNSSNETGFVIERQPAFVNGPVTVGANSTSFVDQTGNGTFRFRVRAVNGAGPSDFTPWASANVTSGSTGTGGGGGTEHQGVVMGATGADEGGGGGGGSGGGSGGVGGTCGGTFGPGVPGPDGWSVITPSADSRIVYVSSSSGDDNNSGLTESAPKRSLVAGYNALRAGSPDWMLLKRGDVWPSVQYASPSWHKSGRSHTEPMVLGSYGTGERPLINSSIWDGLPLTGSPQGIAHLAILDLHLVADGYDGQNCAPTALPILDDVTDLLVENCKFERYFTGVVLQQTAVGHGHPAAISFRRDVIVDCFRVGGAHAQGLFASDTDGLLIEECVMDHNGWREDVPGADPDMFRHNMYLTGSNHNVVVRGCVTARSSNYGIMSRSGGVIEDNLCLDNPCGITVGDDQPGEQDLGGDAMVRRNVVLGSRTLGWGINAVQTHALTIRDNIVAHQMRSNMQSVRGIQITQGHTDVEVASNIVYDWPSVGDGNASVGMINNATASGTVRIHDNSIVLTTGGFVLGDQNSTNNLPVTAQYSNNRYYTTNAQPFQFNLRNTFSDWMNWAHDSGTQWGAVNYPDPSRTISSYMQSIGGSPTLDAFMARARVQERGHWAGQYTAAAVNTYVRGGFGMVPTP